VRFIVAVTLLLLGSPLLGAEPLTEAQARDLAGQLIANLGSGAFAAVDAVLDPRVRDAIGAGGTAAMWKSVTGSTGELRDCAAPGLESIRGMQAFTFPCEFTRGKLDVRIVVSPAAKVVGLRLVPPGSVVAAPRPAPESVVETLAAIGKEPWLLPATIAMPKSGKARIGVVLVHGSGPSDQDGSVGRNAPLRDLAHGLAEHGIASIRYDKRTRRYPGEVAALAHFSVQEEVIDDALAAADAMEKQLGSGACVFIVGHSFGAYLAPRIAAQRASLRGIVMLAPPANTLDKLILTQLAYLDEIGYPDPESAHRAREDVEQKIARMRTLAAAPSGTAAETILGYSTRDAWPDLLAYRPIDTLAALDVPALALFASNDYQVPEMEKDVWVANAKRVKRLEVASFAGLNHLFIASAGTPSPKDYETAGTVAKEVVKKIADWMTAIGDCRR
jgi:dienelactone hydrolase